MSYAVTNPATGETVKTFPTITDAELDAAIAAADEAYRSWSKSTTVEERAALVRRVGGAVPRAPPGARRDHRARDGQADRAGPRRGRFRRSHLRVLRRPLGRVPEGRADHTARRRGLGGHPPIVAGRAPRRHAVELPVLPGRPLRRPEPHHRQHDPAEARAAVPRVGCRHRAHLPRRRLPGRRLREHLRHARADRDGHRRPARAGRLAHRLRAGGRRRRRGRRPSPQEGRARARRLRPLHPALDRRPRRDRAGCGRRAPRQQWPGVQRGQAVHRRR